MNSIDFWDKVFSSEPHSHYKDINYNSVEMPNDNDIILNKALNYFGDIKNKTIVDIGCGRGASSLFFAYHGANVISLDFSSNAINNLSDYCNNNKIKNVSPINLSAQEIDKIGKIDFVFGSMILHHIEPFNEFSYALHKCINDSGKGFFYENNANSKIMMWFRRNIVGKLWIPKNGDPYEYPLTSQELDELRKYFSLKIEFPELFYFRLISDYLLRGYLRKPFIILDHFFYKLKLLNKYSFRQYIFLTR